jgi:hypothetical protein
MASPIRSGKWLAAVSGESVLQDSDDVLEILDPLLEVVPPPDGDEDGLGPASVGHDERVVRERGELIPDAIAKFRLGNDSADHDRSVR